MAERKEYNDATQGNGDWPSWRRLVLSQLEKLEERIEELEKQQHIANLDREIMKTRLTFIVIIGTVFINAALAWVFKKLGV